MTTKVTVKFTLTIRSITDAERDNWPHIRAVDTVAVCDSDGFVIDRFTSVEEALNYIGTTAGETALGDDPAIDWTGTSNPSN